MGRSFLQIARVVRSLGLRYVLEEPACGGLATIDISIRMPDGRKIALEVRLRPKWAEAYSPVCLMVDAKSSIAPGVHLRSEPEKTRRLHVERLQPVRMLLAQCLTSGLAVRYLTLASQTSASACLLAGASLSRRACAWTPKGQHLHA